MTTLRREEREAEQKARKAEKARQRAAEAARRAKEAEAEAEAALREAEEAEREIEAEPDPSETEGSGAEPEGGSEGEPEGASGAEAAGEGEGEGEEASTAPAEKVEISKKAKDSDDADASDDEPGARGRRRLPALGGRAYALIVVNLALAGLLGWLFTAVQGIKADEKATMQAGIAAKQAAEDLSSYDFRTIDADLKRATGHTTGNFRRQFEQQISQVKPSATQQQAVVEGTAVRTAVESLDGDKAIALVYLNQQTAKGASAERTPNQYTLRLVMAKVGDRWLVSELQMI